MTSEKIYQIILSSLADEATEEEMPLMKIKQNMKK